MNRACGFKGGADRVQPNNGFSLLELLLALAIGCGVTATVLQGLLTQVQGSERFGSLMREKALARRTQELVRSDRLQSEGVADPAVLPPACNLAGRKVVLHLATSAGPITYSTGKPSEPIWRGEVLMRCGPAYGLYGELSSGRSQNRVVMDGLGTNESLACLGERDCAGNVRLTLR